MSKRGCELTVLAWLGTAATGCGGWVDLENPKGSGGSTASWGSTPGAAGQSEPAEGGTTGRPAVSPAAGANGTDDLEIFEGLVSPPPTLIPAGADGPGVTWKGQAVIDAGSLESGVLAGANEYCFSKPFSEFSCDWQSREPFFWTEESGMVPLDRLLPGAFAYYPNLVSAEGPTVVGSFNTIDGAGSLIFGGFFRWTEALGATTLGEPPGTDSGGPSFMSRDGRVVAGVAKVAGQSDIVHVQFLWTEAEGFRELAEDASWPEAGEMAGMSADGTQLVGQTIGDAPAAFRWSADRGAEMLGTLPATTTTSCYANRITADGNTIFGFCQDAKQGSYAFRWRATEGVLALTSDPSSCAMRSVEAFSADGSIAFGHATCAGNQPRIARWSESEGVTEMVPPAGAAAFAMTLHSSSSGGVAFGILQPEGMVYTSEGSSGTRAFRWTETDAALALEPLAGHEFSSAYASDSAGEVLVGRSGTDNGAASRAVLWDESGLLDITAHVTSQGIDLRGVELQSADRIAVRGDALLVQGVANSQTRSGVWFARIRAQR
jgi:uncharacterized membrane protein